MRNATKKLVLVGDHGSGKTSLLFAFTDGRFLEPMGILLCYLPTAKIQIDDRNIEVSLWEIQAGDDFDRLRRLCYPQTDCIVMCFAIDSKMSLDSIKTKWASEISLYSEGVPVILVGCKEDRRETTSRPVSREEGLATAQKIGAKYYLECSAKTSKGVQEIFQYATCAALNSSPSVDSLGQRCIIV